MAHTNDVIFTEQGLNKFIQLIRQNPEMISKISVDNTKTNGYYLSVYGADGNDKLNRSPVKIAHKITKAATVTDGTVAFSVDGTRWDLTVHGIVNSLTVNTENTKLPNAKAVRDYTTSYVTDYVKKYTAFIPGSYTVMKDDENTPIWQVQKSTTDKTQTALKAAKVYGAVFNDYAEYRNTVTANPGHVVIENGDGSLSLATQRLQLGANIISDTFGFAIGQTDSAQTPIAVCGRVLAYPYEQRKLFTPGAAVCSGPNGTVSIMTREEIREWPDAIIGYVSEIPTYEYWGTDNIKVDGRLWIKLA